MVFKVNFAKAYDSIRWYFLEDVFELLVLVLNAVRGFVVAYILVWHRSSLMEAQHPNSNFIVD